MATRPLRIFDETLRDGEQQAGLVLSHADKRGLAERIARTGVHYLDLMPAVDEAEADLVRELAGRRPGPAVTPATRLDKRDVDLARACGVERIILFYAVSDRLLFLRDPHVRSEPRVASLRYDDGLPADLVERMRAAFLARARDCVAHAHGLGLAVDFAAEDASRADPEFLVRCLRELAPGLDHFMLCDTVGVLEPERTGRWVRELGAACPDARLAVHFHDDRGLALENTLRAVRAGATCVSGTFGGIGERAGNVALDAVLRALRERDGVEVEGIDYDAVARVRAWLDARGLRPAEPMSAAAFRHESGIHVQSLLHDPRSYCAFDGVEPQIWFGRTSGAANFQYLFEQVLGRPQPRAEYRRLAGVLKARALREGRCWSGDEMCRLLEAGALDEPVRRAS
jgi:isopropylmalate/homocitrate/citramalate synthase